MRKWRNAGIEPSLDELLGDDVMVPVMKSAGLNADDLRTLVSALAERMSPERCQELSRRSVA